jgi:two-component system, OmpR family, response regulator VicR
VVNLGKSGLLLTKDQEVKMTEKVRKVVYIEDEEDMISLVRLILERKGFEIKGAIGGREGLAIIHEYKPDLVLLDLMMPDMDGWDVYQQMKSDNLMADIPVIIVTAKAQNIDKVLGLHIAKVDDYISKPFSPHDLLESIENVLNRKNEGGETLEEENG